MRNLIINTNKQNSFKKRINSGYLKLNLKVGVFGFFFLKPFLFEFLYFIFIKKFLKFFNKNKYSNFNKFKYWSFLTGNFPISKKSKNSRMGKGKGSFLRWSIKLKQNFYFFEFLFFFFIKYFFFLKKLKLFISKSFYYY